ncbi:MAG: cupin domain-containing protein [Parvularculaceae bacterium]
MGFRGFTAALAVGLAIGATSGWFLKPGVESSLPGRPPGSNEVLVAALESAQGFSVVISDVVIPAGKSVPKHTHPGEEFVYVVAGEAIHVEDGSPDVVLKSGESFVIRKGKAHSPRGGANGARAVVFRVHPTGEAERTLIE